MGVAGVYQNVSHLTAQWGSRLPSLHSPVGGRL